MLLVIIAVILFFPTHVFAESNSGSALVAKIYSGLCQGDRDQFRGSGLIFRHGDDAYILTSEHTVVHGNTADRQAVCHRMYGAVFGTRSTSLVRADWGIGLALLKIENGSDIIGQIPYYQDLVTGNVNDGDAVTTHGFPSRSTELFVGSHGRVLTTKSDRAFIPLLSTVLEITGSYGEFGMSGGPLFSADGKTVVGIVSHQFLRYIAGGSSRVEQYSKPEVTTDHLFAIPGGVAQDWLAKSFAKSTQPSFVRDPLAQMLGREDAVFSSGLKFSASMKSCDGAVGGNQGSGIGGNQGSGIGGNQGSGIGGNQGSGIGGNQGSGIGGEDDKADCGMRTVIIDLDVNAHPATFDFFGRSDWRNRLDEQLQKNSKIQVPFYLETQHDQLPRKVPFYSLAEFFRNLSDFTLRPATLINKDQVSQVGKNEEICKRLAFTGAKLKEAVNQLVDKHTVEGLAGRSLLKELNTVASVLDAGDFAILESEWLLMLENERNEGWIQMTNAAFEDSIELLKMLRQIKRDFNLVSL